MREAFVLADDVYVDKQYMISKYNIEQRLNCLMVNTIFLYFLLDINVSRRKLNWCSKIKLKHYQKVIIKGYQINIIEYFHALGCNATEIHHDFDQIVYIPMEFCCLPNVKMRFYTSSLCLTHLKCKWWFLTLIVLKVPSINACMHILL